VYQCQDEEGEVGVELSKDITIIAAKTLRDNLTLLGPHVLPIREQARVVWSYAARHVVAALNAAADRWAVKRLPLAGDTGRYAKPAVYVPDFKLGLQHFCIHAGGRAVIDGIEANLKLAPYHTAPSRATLRDFGNTSSSSIWYELKYAEGAWRGGAARMRGVARASHSNPAATRRHTRLATRAAQARRTASAFPWRSPPATPSSAGSASSSSPLAAASRPTRLSCSACDAARHRGGCPYKKCVVTRSLTYRTHPVTCRTRFYPPTSNLPRPHTGTAAARLHTRTPL
jgi:hypothetical protein